MSNNFKLHAPFYIKKGLSVVPDKFMGKTPLIKGWSAYCKRLPGKDELEKWYNAFDKSNISLCLGQASGIVALDLDATDDKVLEVVKPMLPNSPVIKKGEKGETRFYRFYNEGNTTVKFNGEMVIEVLSTGKKTTMPPSTHPNEMQYVYTSGKTILDINVVDLPMLPPMLLPMIEARLKETFGDKLVNNGNNNFSVDSGRNNTLVAYCGKLIQDRIDLNEAINKLVEKDKQDHSPPLFSDPEEFEHTEPYTNALKLYIGVLNTVNRKHFSKSTQYEVPLLPKAIDASIKEQECLPKLPPGKTGVKSRSPELLIVPSVGKICPCCGKLKRNR